MGDGAIGGYNKAGNQGGINTAAPPDSTNGIPAINKKPELPAVSGGLPYLESFLLTKTKNLKQPPPNELSDDHRQEYWNQLNLTKQELDVAQINRSILKFSSLCG